MKDAESYSQKMSRLMSHPHVWSQMAFAESWGNLQSLRRFYEFCKSGLEPDGKICFIPKASGGTGEDAASVAIEKNKLQTHLMLAQNLKQFDFSRLNRLFIVPLWCDLEVACLHFVADCIMHDPEGLRSRCIPDIKEHIPNHPHNLNRAQCVEKARKVERAAVTLNKKCKKWGLDRLEAVIVAAGIAEEVADAPQPKEELLELHLLRDLFAHRGGLVSEDFKSKCPNFSGELGDPVIVTTVMLDRYFNAALQYMEQLRKRVYTVLKVSDVETPSIEP